MRALVLLLLLGLEVVSQKHLCRADHRTVVVHRENELGVSAGLPERVDDVDVRGLEVDAAGREEKVGAGGSKSDARDVTGG